MILKVFGIDDLELYCGHSTCLQKKGGKEKYFETGKTPSAVTAAIVADRCGSLMHSVAGRNGTADTNNSYYSIVRIDCEH
jgi:hypothetical protein